MAAEHGSLPVSVEAWLGRLGGSTQRAYRRAWIDLFEFTGREPEALTPDDIGRWLSHLSSRSVQGIKRGRRDWQRRGYAEATIAQWAAAISSYYTAAAPARHNPVLAIARPQVRSSYAGARCLTAEETRALLRAARGDTIIERRNYALILILITTGRRSSEVCRMRWGDLRRDGERAWWLRPGSASGEAARLPAAVWRAIVDYLAIAGRLAGMQEADPVFTAVTANASRLPAVGERDAGAVWPLSEREVARVIKRAAQHTGLDPRQVTPTTLRYTAAALRREAGDSVSGISALLGISTTSTRTLLRQAAEAGQDVWLRVTDMLGIPG